MENFLNAPLPTLLVIAGFIFLLLSVATIKRPIVIDINDSGRKVAGIIGGVLLATGIILFVLFILLKDMPNTAAWLPASPHLQVQMLYESFDESLDHPPRYINIPRNVITSGTTDAVVKKGLHVWIVICHQTQQSCTIKELKLDESGEWDTRVDIGAPADDCESFDVSFIVANSELNKIFNERKQTGNISMDEIESFDYIDRSVYSVLRKLNKDLQPVSCS